MQTPNPWRLSELNVHPLWAILEIPLAQWVVRVIALDKLAKRGVLEPVAFGFQETALGLGGIVAQKPVATGVESQPPKTMRHMGPFVHRLLDDLVHGLRGGLKRRGSHQAPTPTVPRHPQ